jgi:hypothetical protein
LIISFNCELNCCKHGGGKLLHRVVINHLSDSLASIQSLILRIVVVVVVVIIFCDRRPRPTANGQLSCVLPFTLYPFWTGVRVKGNPYPVITRLLPGKVEGKVMVKSFHQLLRVIHFTR